MARAIDWLFTRGQRPPVSAWALTFDTAIAVVATVYAIAEVFGRTGGFRLMVIYTYNGPELARIGSPPDPSVPYLITVALMAAPLAVRRRYPLAACAIILAAVLAATPGTLPAAAFATAVLGAYSAVVYSPYRQLAVAAAMAGALASTAVFPDTMPDISGRYIALFVLAPTLAVGLGMREWRRRAGDSAARLRRAQEEHEAATRRAVEEERARIAAELHDVVSHNVSVMVVQAGAARKVLESSPGDAREAMLAVEASGRAAMTELRHLLGLLCPEGPADELRPQPGLAGLDALINRVSAAGLRVALDMTGVPPGLESGVDLAAYRVVQEGLTNVIRHVGEAGVDVVIRFGTEVVITISDDGRGTGSGAGTGRGLIGLRERLALYGGSVEAGPRPGGGWRLRAVIPVARDLVPA